MTTASERAPQPRRPFHDTPHSRVAMIAAAVLSVGVSAVHVDDQGGITAFADPDWLGWAYRLLEVGALVVAGALLFTAGAAWGAGRARLVWVAAVLVGLGPLLGYVFTRTTGLPGATDDIGNWGEPLGLWSLVIEGALILLAGTALLASARHPRPAGHVATQHTHALAL